MRIIILFVGLSFFFACNENNDKATTLVRVESTSYSGFVQHTIYEYDNQGRIIVIREARDDEKAAVKVTITYSGNEAVLISTPDWDPSLIQTSRVVLTLDPSGRPHMRTEYTHKQPKLAGSGFESFVYDTLYFEYDASGFLVRTRGNRYDSTWVSDTRNQVARVTSNAAYTIESGNLIAIDEYVDYPKETRDGGSITWGGGSSEYHTVFKYSKAYSNKTDFRNAAILNEYMERFEAPLDRSWANMPDQVIQSITDRDMNGTIVFEIESTIDMERIYNNDGMLSSVLIPPGNTEFIETRYFYR